MKSFLKISLKTILFTPSAYTGTVGGNDATVVASAFTFLGFPVGNPHLCWSLLMRIIVEGPDGHPGPRGAAAWQRGASFSPHAAPSQGALSPPPLEKRLVASPGEGSSGSEPPPPCAPSPSALCLGCRRPNPDELGCGALGRALAAVGPPRAGCGAARAGNHRTEAERESGTPEAEAGCLPAAGAGAAGDWGRPANFP